MRRQVSGAQELLKKRHQWKIVGWTKEGPLMSNVYQFLKQWAGI